MRSAETRESCPDIILSLPPAMLYASQFAPTPKAAQRVLEFFTTSFALNTARIVSCVLTTVPMLSPGILSLVSINAIVLICVC